MASLVLALAIMSAARATKCGARAWHVAGCGVDSAARGERRRGAAAARQLVGPLAARAPSEPAATADAAALTPTAAHAAHSDFAPEPAAPATAAAATAFGAAAATVAATGPRAKPHGARRGHRAHLHCRMLLLLRHHAAAHARRGSAPALQSASAAG